MAISMSKMKKSRLSKRVGSAKELSFFQTILFKFLHRIPSAILLMILLFLWSSSTTIISEKIVHVCVSSRKLNNLYCLSAGAQPNFEFPIPIINSTSSISTDSSINGEIKEGPVSIPIINSTSSSSSTNSSFNGEIKEDPVSAPISNSTTSSSSTDSSINGEIKEDPVPIISIDSDRDENFANAVKVVEEQLQVHRSWMRPTTEYSNHQATSCDGRGIFVYDLPPKFNKELVNQCGDMIPWMNFCKYFNNEALGEPIQKLGNGWYQTHQYMLEPIFHSRVLNHPCRVHNQNEAKLFYVPFYGGLDILRWHFKNVSTDVRDSLALDLVKWLESQQPWTRNSGKDHVLVLGKISWDFRRNRTSSWGTKFLELNQLQNPIKLLIERQPWHINDIGIPHPTHFHPHSDDDIIAWQLKIMRSNRKGLISFAGAARPDATESIRSILINQCISIYNDEKCRFLDCNSGNCDKPESIIELFMESEFCLQPPGDSPTRKSVFDSLVSGCIPVLFDPFTAYYQYPWHLPEDHRKYSVFIDKEEVRQMEVNVVERLMKVSAREKEDMRRYIVYELVPGLVYGDSSSKLEKFQDAFSITMNNLLERVRRLESNV